MATLSILGRVVTFTLALALGVVGSLPACARTALPAGDAVLRLFDYDRSAPLDVREAARREERGTLVHDITYASPKGGRVPAYLVVPEGRGPFPAILVMHGAPGSRDKVLPSAVSYARTGAVVLAISAPFAREGRGPETIVTFTEKDRDDQIQLICDLRRGVDLLTARPDVDAKRIAYVGGSFGGATGGLLAGVEKRIKAYALFVGDGGPISHFEAMGAAGPFGQMPADVRDRWIEVMSPIEPIRFIGRAAPAALFLQSARRDQYVPVASAEAYQKAASEPKLVKWYDAEHALDAEARADRLAWLAEQIGIDPTKQ